MGGKVNRVSCDGAELRGPEKMLTDAQKSPLVTAVGAEPTATGPCWAFGTVGGKGIQGCETRSPSLERQSTAQAARSPPLSVGRLAAFVP